MLIQLIGCAPASATGSTSTTSADTGGTTTEPQPDREYYQPKILINMAINPNIVLSNENAIGKLIEEKFNVVFEYIPLVGDFNEKANLLLGTGD